MTAQDAEHEPSIEEILDSIRQIISDDDEEAAPAPAAADPEPVDDDVINLTQKVAEPAPPPPKKAVPPPAPEPDPIEVDMQESEPPPPPPRRPAPPPPPRAQSFDSVMTRKAEDTTFEAFAELAERAAIERGGSVTIEDIVREEIKPMLREWVDKHLPDMVERLLQAELDKIARRAQGE